MTRNPEATMYWRGIKAALRERGLLRQFRLTEDGRELVVPQAHYVVFPDRIGFVLDMQRLGGVPREKWLDRDLWAQIRATLQGRQVMVSDTAGLAVVVAREPGEHVKRLPARVVLTPDDVPRGAYVALLGESRAGPVVLDLAGGERAILVGGSTGKGKTSAIRSLVLQLIHENAPDTLKLAVVDLKRLDFVTLDGLPHLVRPVATTEAEAVDLVAWCVQEMERRLTVMNAHRVTRWDRLPDGDRFPLLLLVIDECADFADGEVVAGLVKLARKSRAVGIALILATQRPSREVLNRQVKANLETRVAFAVTDRHESDIILDRPGAEKLRHVGRCLTNAGGEWHVVQAAYVPDDALGEWVDVAPGGPALGDAERALVAYALEELGGAFTINALADAFQGEISRRQLLKLGKAWELRGWLTPSNDVTEPRRVTDELADLARGNGGNARGNGFEAVVPRGISGNVVTENAPGAGGGDLLPPFLRGRYREVNDGH